jgi:AraC-like DNA-binding protein
MFAKPIRRILMKANYTILSDIAHSQKSFFLKKITRPYFSTDFHFHKECQLVYVLAGSGIRIIGHSIERFEKGDLTFVGSNVPHVWYSDSASDQDREEAMSLALYINADAICEQLSMWIDTKEIHQFFKESERGIKIEGEKKAMICGIMEPMLEQRNITQLSSFLRIMDILREPADTVWLNAPDPISTYSAQPPGRIPKLMGFIHQNFKEQITLQQAASVSGLQLHAFCRFFKSLTNRTFSEFLNDVRIGFACNLLQQSELSVTQIALECGYVNISYFNRCFKKINKMTPKEYRHLLTTKNHEHHWRLGKG